MRINVLSVLSAIIFVVVSFLVVIFRIYPTLASEIYSENHLEFAQCVLEILFTSISILTGIIIFKANVSDGNKFIEHPEGQQKTWLTKKAWNSPLIQPQLQNELSVAAIFATVSLGVVTFYTGLTLRLLGDGNYAPLFYLSPFLLVASGMLVYSIIVLRQWIRFGNTILKLDPYPGSIGGQIGGEIDLKLPYRHNNYIRVRLDLIHRYVVLKKNSISSTGTSDEMYAEILWSANGLAYTEPSQKGTKLRILFDIPKDLQDSAEISEKNGIYNWELNVSAILPGPDFNQVFIIPVFKTSENAVNLKKLSRAHPDLSISGKQDAFSFLKIKRADDGGLDLRYSKLHKFRLKAGLILFTVGVGTFLPGLMMVLEGVYGVGIPFFIVGLLFVISGTWLLLSNIKVNFRHNIVVATKTFAGIPFSKKRVSKSDITYISGKGYIWIKMKNGSEHQISPYFENEDTCNAAKAELGLRTGIKVS